MKTLLSKTLSHFLLCTVGIFLLTMPLFYILTKHFYAEDMIDIIEAVQQGKNIPPLDLENDIMAGMMIQFLLIFIVLSLALFITVHFITRRLWQPFDDTLAKVEKFNLAQGEVPRFCDTEIKEFLRLNRSFTLLMEKDKETYLMQKEFTENASHELQTPLAIIRSKLDLLMQEDMDEQQMMLIDELYQLTTRMGHLNRNLLLLAKIENAQYAEMEELDIATLLSVSLPMYGVLQNGISLSVDDSRDSAYRMLRANPVLLECLLNNLVVNAIRHSDSDGEVKVWLKNESLIVSNTSDGSGALDAGTIFCRFHSGGVQKQGNGLGLSIVKAICDFHKWAVSYAFKEGAHNFVVSFRINE